MEWLFEPGFFASPEVHVALMLGGVSALVSAVVGVFTVVRGQSFAGHALSDVSATGGSGALLAGVNPLAGFLLGSLLGAGAMEAVGVQRARGRDLATGVVLGTSMGVTSLLLYLTTSTGATTGATQRILFGSIFATTPSTVPLAAFAGAASIGIVAVIYRPLLLATVNPEIAAAKGTRVRLLSLAYSVALALAVGLSALTIGAILSTALLIGPPATALRLTKRMGRSVAASMAIGLLSTWVGILLAYDSADWRGGHVALPVSFCVVAVVLVAYLIAAFLPHRAHPSFVTGSTKVELGDDLHLVLEEDPCSENS